MRVRALLFAGLREAAGRDALELELPEGARVRELRAAAQELAPALAAHSYAVAVDAAYAAEDQPLAEGAEVALLPPVSGG